MLMCGQALFVPAVLAGYAYMVSSHLMDPDVLMGHERQAQLPAQVGGATGLRMRLCIATCEMARGTKVATCCSSCTGS